jgi:oligopeptide/dipeptide ABC transporter ATP-binding protein
MTAGSVVIAGPPSGNVLEVSDLQVGISTRRGLVRAVDGVSLEVPRGEAVGLVGESGSGKSMTLKAILGVLPPEARISAGQIVLDGVDLVPLPTSALNRIRGPKLAMIFQEPMSALNPVMRVGWQIAEGPRVHLGYSRSKAAERAVELMRRVGIPDPERRFRAYPHEFSGGMRQRVMIAIALSCDPEVILCRESGVSLLFVTHDLPVVAQLCQSVAVMYGGQIVERGAVEQVFAQPCHPYTLGLLRSAPDVEQVRASLVPIPGSPPSLISPPSGCRFHPRCKFAEQDCTEINPPLRLIDAGHATACLHFERCLDELPTEGAQR